MWRQYCTVFNLFIACREVIHLNRPLRCDSCCFPCCLQSLEVSSPRGEVIGYVNQLWSCMKPK